MSTNERPRIHFYAAKGGSGVSTLAAATALVAGRENLVTLYSTDPDMPAIFGTQPRPPFFSLTDSVSLSLDGIVSSDHALIVDHGTEPSGDMTGLSILVLRGPCYLALRNAVAMTMRPDYVVIVREPGRSLDEATVEDVLGVPVLATIEQDPAVARAMDAGIFTMRLPKTLERVARLALDRAEDLTTFSQ